MSFLDFIPLVGDVVKGVTGLIGTNQTNKNNRKIADAQNALNYRMFQEQNKFNTEMWHAQNAYNTPLAQVDRLRQAGINPYLALSNIQTGQAGNVTSASASPAVGYEYKSPISEFGYSLGQGAQDTYNAIQRSKEVEASVALTEANKRNVDADTLSKLSDANFKDERNRAEIDKIRQEIENSRANEKYVKEQTKQLEETFGMRKEQLQAEINKTTSEVELNKVRKDVENYKFEHLLPLEKQKLVADIGYVYQSIRYMLLQGKVAMAQVGALVASAMASRASARASDAQAYSLYEQGKLTRANREVVQKSEDFVLDNLRKDNAVKQAQAKYAEDHEFNKKISGDLHNAKTALDAVLGVLNPLSWGE